MPKSLTDSLSVLNQIGQAFIALGSIEYEFSDQIPGSTLDNGMAIIPQTIVPSMPKPATISL